MTPARASGNAVASRDSAAAGQAGGRGGIAELQRARIVSAMSELVREHGRGTVTVAHVVSRSGVSRRTFYELFEDREECLFATLNHAVGLATAAMRPAYQMTPSDQVLWEERVRAALNALLRFLDEQPVLGSLLVVDVLAGEHRLLERRARIVDALVDVLHRGARTRIAASTHHEAPAPAPSRIVAEGVVGAVLAVLHTRLLEPAHKPLRPLLSQLTSIVVLPYLGPAAAARELVRPTPRTRPRRVCAPPDPLRELDMRLTYRTVRVLLAIAELGDRGCPPSSREVSDTAGVVDQGQISKLLRRLEYLGLVANRRSRQGRGEPNAWTLTLKGSSVVQAIRARTGS